MVIAIIDDETRESTGEIILEPEEYKAVLDLVGRPKKQEEEKMKFKTLKDIEKWIYERLEKHDAPFNVFQEIRKEAIKWIKEDYELVINYTSHKMLERWKERLNISEEDLK